MKITKLEELLTLELKKGKIFAPVGRDNQIVLCANERYDNSKTLRQNKSKVIYKNDIKVYDEIELHKAIKFLEKNEMI